MKNTILALGLVVMYGCGSRGQMGLQGEQGSSGINGSNGSSCSVTTISVTNDFPTGGSLITCTDGTSSVITNGVKGDTGSTGAVGATGQAGTPGTVLTAIQFCDGTPSYPSTFPEIGVCANGNLYGVYSANDGFLALLPPGQYTSNGINSSCTFTIGENCSVTRN